MPIRPGGVMNTTNAIRMTHQLIAPATATGCRAAAMLLIRASQVSHCSAVSVANSSVSATCNARAAPRTGATTDGVTGAGAGSSATISSMKPASEPSRGDRRMSDGHTRKVIAQHDHELGGGQRTATEGEEVGFGGRRRQRCPGRPATARPASPSVPPSCEPTSGTSPVAATAGRRDRPFPRCGWVGSSTSTRRGTSAAGSESARCAQAPARSKFGSAGRCSPPEPVCRYPFCAPPPHRR